MPRIERLQFEYDAIVSEERWNHVQKIALAIDKHQRSAPDCVAILRPPLMSIGKTNLMVKLLVEIEEADINKMSML